ncbi:uncharacterized protein LOC110020122 [Phalaenopsis equestris]|uniref:uncharacterized protein LOC110020122 n=1 Tax=Phalaenopsis equestris TaxID=78828 RepID=UPI0009E4D2EF|nr:uncharacterized protein LOC110020122 [Phalaenopsis equestris]
MEWPSSSLKQKIRSANCFPCCFRSSEEGEEEPAVGSSLIRSSSTWIRSKAAELPEFKERYRWLMARSGKSSQRRGFGEFRYDPFSYALNFDEGGEEEADEADGSRYRNFSSRLPATPLQPSAGVAYS